MTLVVARSPHDVVSTVDRVVDALNQRAIEVFARIDHAGGARAAGLELADEVLLVFGRPAVGALCCKPTHAHGSTSRSGCSSGPTAGRRRSLSGTRTSSPTTTPCPATACS